MNLHQAQEIRNGLWLGSLRAANDVNFQLQQHFALIIRLHNPPPTDVRRPLEVRRVLKRLQVREYYIAIPDHPAANLSQYFDEVVRLVGQYCRVKGGVLIHCDAGISRSTTLITACLIAYNHQVGIRYPSAHHEVNDVLAEIWKKRPGIKPNPGFYQQLVAYANSLRE